MTRKHWIAATVLLAAFFASRLAMHLGLRPFLDVDSFKYLGGADALFAGQALPAIFRDLPVTGGGLHAVPGYPWFMDAVWRMTGGVSLHAVAAANSAVSLLGYLAAAHLAGRAAGATAGLVLLGLLVLSPPLAALEYTIMPDAVAAPLCLVTAWLALVAGPALRPVPSAAAALFAGALAAANILMRTASQVFFPFPIVLAAMWHRPARRMALWLALYGIAAAATLAPWMLRNLDVHGSYRLSASTGRNLYFSACWAGTIDRGDVARQLGVTQTPDRQACFKISDAAIARRLEKGESLAQADAVLAWRTLHAWWRTPLPKLIEQRGRTLWSLFDADLPEAEVNAPLRRDVERYLDNAMYQPGARRWAERRYKHEFSESLDEEFDAPGDHPAGVRFFSAWARLLTFDGVPLFLLFLIATPCMLISSRERWPLWWSFAAPPLAYLCVYVAMGAALYRYQVSLHPFFWSTLVVAAFDGGRRLARAHHARASAPAARNP